MSEHTHTATCAEMSRYALVQVRIVVESSGDVNARISMKPSGACWESLDTIATVRVPGYHIPASPEECASIARDALGEAYPALF